MYALPYDVVPRNGQKLQLLGDAALYLSDARSPWQVYGPFGLCLSPLNTISGSNGPQPLISIVWRRRCVFPPPWLRAAEARLKAGGRYRAGWQPSPPGSGLRHPACREYFLRGSSPYVRRCLKRRQSACLPDL